MTAKEIHNHVYRELIMPSLTAAPIFLEGYHPGHIGRVVELHGTYYSKHWGSGAEFEILMAAELAEFCKKYTPERDLLLTAHTNKLVGSIAVHGSDALDNSARLRWFIVDEACHGQGIGRALLERTLVFCRARAFRKLYLWTVDELPQSRHLYESVGFFVVEQVFDSRYGILLNSLKLEMELA